MKPSETLEWAPLRLEDFVRYAGASGDYNPLHYDPAAAEAAGLPAPIAQGMLLAGLVASSLETWFGPGAVRDLSLRFRRPAFVGDTLLARLDRQDDDGAVSVTLLRGDAPVVTAEARLEAAP